MKNIKNTIVCSLIGLIGVLVAGFYSSYITKKTLEQRSFETRIKSELSQLDSFKKQKIDELLFAKSVFLFGSITQITENNFHISREFCSKLDANMLKWISSNIEKKVPIASRERELFNEKISLLLEKCK